MKGVVYNPHCTDSVFSAAVLKTVGGYIPFSCTEHVNESLVNEGSYLWLNTLPTRRCSSFGKLPEGDHVCLTRHPTFTSEEQHSNVIYNPDESGTSGVPYASSLLSRVTKTIGREVQETHALNMMVESFYNPLTPSEVVNTTIFNVTQAIGCLRGNGLFTPLLLNPSGVVSNAHKSVRELSGDLISDMRRVISLEVFRDEHGQCYSYLSSNWWLLRRLLYGKKVTNVHLSATGARVDTTGTVVPDLGVRPLSVIRH